MSRETLVFHTHWDREWYSTFRQYQHRLVSVLDELLDLLSTEALSCFTLDGQTALLDDYFEFRPEKKAELAQLVQAQRLSIGPWFVMPDEFLVSGESLIRNLELGMETSLAYGQKTFTGYLPDTFGHSADIPMILTLLGIDSAVVWRGVAPASSVFFWESPSSQRVKTLHLSEGYFQHHAHMDSTDAEAIANMQAFAAKVASHMPQNSSVLFPVGADHLGLKAFVIDRAKKAFPKAMLGMFDTFMAELKPNASTEVISGELTDCSKQYILPGVYSARLYLKQMNRRLEWQLSQQLEPLLSLLKTLDAQSDFEAERRFLWRTLMLNHPHDSICGCSIDEVHRENEVRFAEVSQKLSYLLNDVHWDLYQRTVASNEANTVMAVNMTDKPYTGVLPLVLTQAVNSSELLPHNIQVLSTQRVLDRTDKREFTTLPLAENKVDEVSALLWVENLPPRSVQQVVPQLAPSKAVQTTLKLLENERIRLTVSDDGLLCVEDKQTGQRHTRMHQLTRTRQQGDSYNAAPVPGSSPEYAQLEQVSVMDDGPFRGTLQLRYRFPLSLFAVSTTVHLDAGSSQLQFQTHFTNQLKNHQLQVSFESAEPVSTIQAEGHFNVITRHYDPNYRIEDAMPAAAQTELKTNTGPIQRFIQWQNQALITEGLTEYEVEGNQVKLTLLRAFGMLSKDDTGVRGSHAGPPLETPEGQCLNRPSICRYAWLPCETSNVNCLYTEADRFYGAVYGQHFAPLPAHIPAAKFEQSAHQLISLDNPAVHITACHLTSDGWRLRLMNPTEQVQSVTITGAFPKTAQLKKQIRFGKMESLSDWTLSIPPKSVVSLAIIN